MRRGWAEEAREGGGAELGARLCGFGRSSGRGGAARSSAMGGGGKERVRERVVRREREREGMGVRL